MDLVFGTVHKDAYVQYWDHYEIFLYLDSKYTLFSINSELTWSIYNHNNSYILENATYDECYRELQRLKP